MKKSVEKELDDILWQSSILSQLEGLKSVSEITDKLQEIVDARVDKYVKEQREIDIERACEWIRQTYMGDYAEDEVHNSVDFDTETFLEDFKNAML